MRNIWKGQKAYERDKKDTTGSARESTPLETPEAGYQPLGAARNVDLKEEGKHPKRIRVPMGRRELTPLERM